MNCNGGLLRQSDNYSSGKETAFTDSNEANLIIITMGCLTKLCLFFQVSNLYFVKENVS